VVITIIILYLVIAFGYLMLPTKED